jgi:Ca2+-binding RTX toxin-like protein
MSKRGTRIGWLRSLAPSLFRRRFDPKSPVHRRARLEHLEFRYALAAPVAVNDSIFMNVNTVAVPTEGQILALNNDTDADSLHSVLKIVEVGFGEGTTDVSVASGNVNISLEHGELTVVYQNAHLEHFIYVPDVNFTGTEQFTYRISDGSAPFSNLATVTINVRPYTGIGDDVTDFIHEGDGVHLSDIDIEDGENPEDPPVITSRSGGPDLEYYWYIDTISGADPFDGDYDPPEESLVELAGGLPVDHSVALLDLAWEDLAALGITDGNDGFEASAILSLKVVDANGFEALASTFLSVVDFIPQPTVFMLSPATTDGCGDSTVVLSATFAEPNPAEDTFTVSIDWDLFDADPSPVENLSYTDNLDGTYTVTAVTHNYAPGVNYLPMLYIVGEDADEASPVPFPFNGWFLLSPPDVLQFDPLPFAKIRDPGTEVALASPQTANAYAWSVTKDGQPLPLPPGTVTTASDFSFTPTDPGVYLVRLVTTTEFSPGFTFDETFEDTTIVVGGGSSGVTSAAITGAVPSGSEGTLINLGSDIEGGCGTPVYAWSVFKDGSGTPFDTGSDASFSFTPTDNGSYVVNLTVDGVPADPQTIAVTNVAPSNLVASISQAAAGSPEVTVDVSSFTDPGTGDSFTLHIEWGPGDTQDVPLLPGSLPITHTYHSIGEKPISVTVVDDDGGESNEISASFTVQAAENNGSLEVMGSDASDEIVLSSGSVIVTINGVEVGEFEVTGSVSVVGGDGDDTIIVEVAPVGGVNVDGEGGSDSVVIDGNGSLAGSVALSDSGASGTDSVQVLGTPGNDSIEQTSGGFVLNGVTISLSSGLDTAAVEGGAGSDEIVVSGSPPVPVEVEGVSDMVVIGTSGNDHINFTPGLSAGEIIAQLNGVEVSRFSPTGRLVARGGDGDDQIHLAGSINLSSWLYGGAGNDRLKGGAGHDILLGDEGNDLLVGGPGRDILIGGDGADGIHGKSEDDILVSGIVSFGSNLDAALTEIKAEWLSSYSFAARTANIEGWGCEPTTHQLNSTTVLDDEDKDTLTGDQGLDWFFANLWLDGDDEGTKDKIVDLNFFEFLFANDLDFIEGE